ncbi:MAG: hypothetical protein ACK4GJ_06565, partial [bacterium]
YRVLTFILWFLSGVFVYKILKTMNFMKESDRFYISLLFLISPLYVSKIALICFPYTFCNAVFYYGFYLVSISDINRMEIKRRLYILFLFFISFFTNSFLVFYLVVLLYMFYKVYDSGDSFLGNLRRFVISKLDFLLLPIVFFVIKSIYFASSGFYEDYNRINLNYIYDMKMYALSFVGSFIEPLKDSLGLAAVIVYANLIYISLFIYFSVSKEEIRRYCILFSLGIFLFLLGSLPYVAVGKIPADIQWDSRLQLLLPLGFSLILYGTLSVTSEIFGLQRFLKVFLVFIVVSFMYYHAKNYIKYNMDWYYQKGVIENFRENKKIYENTTFIVNDSELRERLAKKRYLACYEYAGMSREAFNLDDKLFVPFGEKIELYSKYKIFITHNFSNWIYKEPVYLTIKGIKRNALFYFYLKYLELFNKDRFKDEIKKLVVIEVKNS